VCVLIPLRQEKNIQNNCQLTNSNTVGLNVLTCLYKYNITRELVGDCCLTPTQQFFSFIILIFKNDDEDCFVIDQYAELDFHSASSLQKQSMSQPVCALSP